MGWTKRQIIYDAYEEIGYSHSMVDIPPEKLSFALRRLDALMQSWESTGIDVEYNIPLGGSSLGDDSEIIDAGTLAVVLNLSIAIAPSVGKTPTPQAKVNAKNALDNLKLELLINPETTANKMPYGQGNKYWQGYRKRYTDEPE